MVTWNEIIEGVAADVSDVIVTLTVVVPPPLLTVRVSGPLQDEKEKTASTSTKSRVLLRFMRHPTPE